jgi:hypothetical protein
MNKEAMLAVADVIEWADRFDIGTMNSASTPDALWEQCDTVGCFAGWAAAWADRRPWRGGNGSYLQIGAEEFGLTDEQAGRLFMGDGTWHESPQVLKIVGGESLWCRSADDEAAPRQAAALLRAVAKGKIAL